MCVRETEEAEIGREEGGERERDCEGVCECRRVRGGESQRSSELCYGSNRAPQPLSKHL